MREDMVTAGAGMVLGRSSVRTGSIQKIVTPASQSRFAKPGLLEAAGPEDDEEEYGTHYQGEREPD
jgi:hypothetical protein